MTTKDVLNLLEIKNQNLPAMQLAEHFKGISTVYIPAIEGEEKNLQKQFDFLKKVSFSGKKGEKTRLIYKDQIIHLIGMGDAQSINSRTVRRFYGSTYLSATQYEKESLGFYCPSDWLKWATVGIQVAGLSASLYKPKFKAKKIAPVTLFHPDIKKGHKEAEKELQLGLAIAEGKNTMRILGATPPNVLHPQSYAEIAMTLAKKHKIKARRINGRALKDYGLVNAVCAGSQYEPELLIFTLHPKKGKTKNATAIVGKGLCFDSGGKQDKGSYMKSMREDMGGSASTFGALMTIVKGKMEVKETTHFALILAENMSDAKAMRPDDIYIAGDGQSVEIIHTDAEGRLALADAICYLKKHEKNINKYYTIATLTGSCVSALGDVYTGSLCNDDEFAGEVMKTGKLVGDYVHMGPWDMEYDDNNSPMADVANLGQNSREAGWIKAGYFLYRFIPKDKKNQAKFCHLDIAGSIDMDEKGKGWRKKGFNSGGLCYFAECTGNEITAERRNTTFCHSEFNSGYIRAPE